VTYDSDYGVLRKKTDGVDAGDGNGTCTITKIEKGIITGGYCS
jgi:hypothetical protein